MNQFYTQDAVSPLMIQTGEPRLRRHRELDLRAVLSAAADKLRTVVRVPVSE